jgi:hypothetical protein
VKQETVEAEILAVLETVALPTGYAEAVDAAMAAYVGTEGRKSRTETVRGLDERQRRLNEMYELGRLSATDYKGKSADLDAQRVNLTAKRAEPVLVRQRTMLTTLVEDWDEMTTDERRRVIGTVFAEVHVADGAIAKMLPRDDWKPYMEAVLRTPTTLKRWGTERKTGLEPATLTLAR